MPSDQGWYDASGFHNPTNTNYYTGNISGALRGFFVFNIPSLSPDQFFASGSFSVFSFQVNSSPSPQTITLFDYSGSIPALVGGGFSDPAAIARFNDLGTGITYGSRSYTSTEDNSVFNFTLNSNALSAINARGSSGGGLFAFGLRNSAEGTFDNFVFAFSDSDSRNGLQLQVAPAPLPLGAAPVLGLLAYYRRKLKSRYQDV